jgi:hypothetical protein
MIFQVEPSAVLPLFSLLLYSLLLNGEPRLESLVWRASSWIASSGPGDLMLGNSVPCGNPDSALDSTFSYTLSYRSAPGEPERILRNRG